MEIMQMQEYNTEKLKVAREICNKIDEFHKQHPQQYAEEDAIKEAEAITNIYKSLPNFSD